MYYIPVDEQETTISYCRAEKTVKVWTNDRTVMTKLDKMVAKSPYYTAKKQYNRDGDHISTEYIIQNKKLISFRSGVHSQS